MSKIQIIKEDRYTGNKETLLLKDALDDIEKMGSYTNRVLIEKLLRKGEAFYTVRYDYKRVSCAKKKKNILSK